MTLPSTNQFNDVSTSGMGTYEFTIAANTTSSAGCRKYYVKAIDSYGYAYYYPSFGYLLTQDENTGCTQHYLAQKKASDTGSIPIQPIASKSNYRNNNNGTVFSNANALMHHHSSPLFIYYCIVLIIVIGTFF